MWPMVSAPAPAMASSRAFLRPLAFGTSGFPPRHRKIAAPSVPLSEADFQKRLRPNKLVTYFDTQVLKYRDDDSLMTTGILAAVSTTASFLRRRSRWEPQLAMARPCQTPDPNPSSQFARTLPPERKPANVSSPFDRVVLFVCPGHGGTRCPAVPSLC